MFTKLMTSKYFLPISTFLFNWLLFGVLANWWVGLLTAIGLTCLQEATRRALKNVKVEE